jgi:hypothetical protein
MSIGPSASVSSQPVTYKSAKREKLYVPCSSTARAVYISEASFLEKVGRSGFDSSLGCSILLPINCGLTGTGLRDGTIRVRRRWA